MSAQIHAGGSAVGIFDSGVGGLTVLREIRRAYPRCSVIYAADTANVPYGEKPLDVVCDLALGLTDLLVRAGAGAIVMASGTSTVAGLTAAQQRYPELPISGTIAPGARAAVEAGSGAIGVIATTATCRSRAFTNAVRALDPQRSVWEQGCPPFVPLVESGQAGSDAAFDAACEYLRPLLQQGVGTIILGCTHFPFLLPALRRAVETLRPGQAVTFVDPAQAVARELSQPFQLTAQDAGRVEFLCTGDTGLFAESASRLLGETISPVRQIRLAGAAVAAHAASASL